MVKRAASLEDSTLHECARGLSSIASGIMEMKKRRLHRNAVSAACMANLRARRAHDAQNPTPPVPPMVPAPPTQAMLQIAPPPAPPPALPPAMPPAAGEAEGLEAAMAAFHIALGQ